MKYLFDRDMPIAECYGEIVRDQGVYRTTKLERTGCMFCAFGAHLEKYPNRFQKMQRTHPKQWEYCMRPCEDGGLGMARVLDFIGVPWEDRQETIL